jgi:hypothetical protein
MAIVCFIEIQKGGIMAASRVTPLMLKLRVDIVIGHAWDSSCASQLLPEIIDVWKIRLGTGTQLNCLPAQWTSIPSIGVQSRCDVASRRTP